MIDLFIYFWLKRCTKIYVTVHMMAISMLGKTYTPKQERHLNNEVKTDLMYINLLHLFTEL